MSRLKPCRRELESDADEGANFSLTPEISQISETMARLPGLKVAGVDLLFSGDKFVLCEVNSPPGFRGFETYCGVDVAGTAMVLAAACVLTELATAAECVACT
jgi:glutathione synthase/RimK-type ligase-like ATP-grasp enzyme